MIGIRCTKTENFVLESTSRAPQIEKLTPKDHPSEYQIKAAIDTGGVYPLSVSSGGIGQTGLPGWPVMLTIEPGVELLYRLDNQAVVHHDGASQLVLGPIHRELVFAMVRVVAFARNQPRLSKRRYSGFA